MGRTLDSLRTTRRTLPVTDWLNRRILLLLPTRPWPCLAAQGTAVEYFAVAQPASRWRLGRLVGRFHAVRQPRHRLGHVAQPGWYAGWECGGQLLTRVILQRRKFGVRRALKAERRSNSVGGLRERRQFPSCSRSGPQLLPDDALAPNVEGMEKLFAGGPDRRRLPCRCRGTALATKCGHRSRGGQRRTAVSARIMTCRLPQQPIKRANGNWPRAGLCGGAAFPRSPRPAAESPRSGQSPGLSPGRGGALLGSRTVLDGRRAQDRFTLHHLVLLGALEPVVVMQPWCRSARSASWGLPCRSSVSPARPSRRTGRSRRCPC